MSPSRDALSRYPRPVALGAAGRSALHFFSFFDPKIPIYTDIRYFVYFAWRIAEGAVPHSELFDNKTFGSHFVSAFFYRIGNALGVDELQTMRLACLAVCGLAGWGVYLVFRRLDGGRAVGGLLGLLAYLAFGFLGSLAAIGPFPKLFMPVLALVAALLVRRERWLWAGAMGGLAFMDWQIGALVWLAAFISAGLQAKRKRRALARVFLGGLVGIAPFVVYYALAGGLQEAAQQTIAASFFRGEQSMAQSSELLRWTRIRDVLGSVTRSPGTPSSGSWSSAA